MNKAAHNGLQVSHTFVPPSLLLTPLPTVFLPEAPLFQHRQPPSAGAMNALRLTFTLLVLLWALPQELRGQSLAEAARKERNRRARLPGAAVTYTNEALHAQAGRFGVSSSDRATPATSRRRPSRSAAPSGPTREELGWSRRFLQVKARLAAAEQRHETLRIKRDDLNLKLQGDPFRQTTVTDPAHVYAPLIAQAERRLEQSRQVLSGARQELAGLRERLRQSGKPRSWEDSRAALAPGLVGAATDGAGGPPAPGSSLVATATDPARPALPLPHRPAGNRAISTGAPAHAPRRGVPGYRQHSGAGPASGSDGHQPSHPAAEEPENRGETSPGGTRPAVGGPAGVVSLMPEPRPAAR